MELYEKKVKIVNPKTGEITYNWMTIRDGMDKVKQGGKSLTNIHSCESVCD